MTFQLLKQVYCILAFLINFTFDLNSKYEAQGYKSDKVSHCSDKKALGP